MLSWVHSSPQPKRQLDRFSHFAHLARQSVIVHGRRLAGEILSPKKRSAVAEMGDRGHNRHGPKRGGCCARFAGEQLGPRLTQYGLRRGLLPYQVAPSPTQPFGHNRHQPKTGGYAPFRGAATPSNTTSPGPRFTSVPCGILIHPEFGHNRHGPKIRMGCTFFLGGGAVCPSNPKSHGPTAEAYLYTKSHLSPYSHLVTTDIGRKLGDCVPLGRGSWVPI